MLVMQRDSSGFKERLLSESSALRQAIRRGEHSSMTSGLASGLVQGNVVILPADWAGDFLTYCQNNPVSCPLIAVSEAGNPALPGLGLDIDIRHDVPEYNIFRDGELVETTSDIAAHWQSDMVAFVLGCSFSFEDALQQAGLSVRNIDMDVNVSMYRSNIPTVPGGRFHGDMVVSMRPFIAADAIRAVQVTTRLPKAHGAPVHFGDPSLIGINDLSAPDFGDAVELYANELPVFWACGVTPQVAVRNAKPPICITHVPGKMLITDLLNAELAIL